jgi:hypothetical protein
MLVDSKTDESLRNTAPKWQDEVAYVLHSEKIQCFFILENE